MSRLYSYDVVYTWFADWVDLTLNIITIGRSLRIALPAGKLNIYLYPVIFTHIYYEIKHISSHMYGIRWNVSLQSARCYSGSCDSQASTSQEFWKWNLLRDCDRHLLLGTAFFLVSPPLNCAAYEHILPTSGFTEHDLCMPLSLCSKSILQCVPEKKTAKRRHSGLLWSSMVHPSSGATRLPPFEHVWNLCSKLVFGRNLTNFGTPQSWLPTGVAATLVAVGETPEYEA